MAELAASTGGVKIVWSKKLNSTAGRACWKRVTGPAVSASGEKTITHHASIELAEKVIDDEERLINVLAHEFCHLANFMIGGIKDRPHGKEFKEWARKVSRAFEDRNVVVTTKHSYDIDYKYVWECVECGTEYKRHSKSINPTKHCCSDCKGKLAQTKPKPRDGTAKPSEYQLFFKEHFSILKKQNPGKPHGEVMEILVKMYKEAKKNKAEVDTTNGDNVQTPDVIPEALDLDEEKAEVDTQGDTVLHSDDLFIKVEPGSKEEHGRGGHNEWRQCSNSRCHPRSP